jgi:ketosteroid isomerase-like protein
MPMKKFVLPAIAAMLICLVSCNESATTSSPGGESEKAKKNLENAKGVTDMFNKNDFSKIGDYIAADAVDHSGMNGEVKGLDSLKKMFEGFASMMKDSKNESVKAVADDDYVFQWSKESWTDAYDDPKMMMKAGEHHTMDAIHVTKHNADGKITDHWGFIGMNDAMKMMADMSKSMGSGMMPMDTTGKSKMQKK